MRLSIKDEDVRAIGALAAARTLRKAVARGLVEVDDEWVMTLIRPEVAEEEKQQELALLQATAPRPRSGGTILRATLRLMPTCEGVIRVGAFGMSST